jgi:hypothetical protein
MAYQEISNALLVAGAPLDSALLIQMNENAKAARADSLDNKKGRVLRSARHTDTTSRSFGTVYGLGYTAPNFIREKSGSESRIKVEYRIPVRNDSLAWGGCYNQIEYSIDNGTSWTVSGDDGYGSGSMGNTSLIDADTGVIWFDNLTGSQFRIRLQHRSYDGTVQINVSQGIGAGDWAYTNIYIEEISV